MKSLLFFLLGVLCFSHNSFSQTTPNWAWGADYSGSVISSCYHNNYNYVIGNYNTPTTQIGSILLSNGGDFDLYIAKWDTLGNLIWAKSISDTASQTGVAIHVNSNNELVIAGNNTNPNLIIGNDTITSGTNNGAFIATYDLNGNILDAFGLVANTVYDFCNDGTDNIYAATSSGILKYSNTGMMFWQNPIYIHQIRYSSINSKLKGVGSFINTLTLGGTTIVAAYSATWGPEPDLYCVQLDLNGNLDWLTQVSNTVRADMTRASYIQESTGDLFLPVMTFGLGGMYTSINQISTGGIVSNIPFSNVDLGVALPSSSASDYPEILNISGKDSFLSFCLLSTNYPYSTSALGIFNLNSQKTILSLNCSSDYHYFNSTNSIYMSGSAGLIYHMFGKLGNSVLSSSMSHTIMNKCIGSTVTLNGNITGGVPPLSYSWSPSTGLSSTTNSTTSFVASSNISYTLTVTDANSQVVKDTFDIIVDSPLSALIITPQYPAFCHDSMYLYSNLGVDANWYKYDGIYWILNYPIYNDDQTIVYGPGLYTASSTNSCGTVTDTIQIQSAVNVIANASLTDICVGQSVTLSGSGALSYTWTGGVVNNVSFNPVSSQTYTVTGIDSNGCIDTSSIQIFVYPTTSSITTISICQSLIPYNWNSQQFDSTGFYTSTFINSHGCDSIASLNLTVNPTTTSTTNATICSTALPYVWNTLSLTTTGTYTANFTSTSGCDSIATLNLNVNSTSSSVTNTTICSSSLPYVWNTQSLIVSGTYTANLINASGCDSIATLILQVNAVPQPIITQNSYTLTCTNTINSHYQWYLNGTAIGTDNNILAITQNGQYIVKVSDSVGCIGFDTINVEALGFQSYSSNSSISIYPNPSSELIHIEFELNQSGICNIQLLDASGRVVADLIRNQKISQGKIKQTYNLKKYQLAEGIYLLSGNFNGIKWIKRITYSH